MPKHYIDEEWDRDALFADRNHVTLEFAAEQLKVTPHAVQTAAGRQHGSLLLWVFGSPGKTMRKYRELYVDMLRTAPRLSPDRLLRKSLDASGRLQNQG
jgi:hypothetical protein